MNPGGWFEHVLKTPRLFRDLTTLELVTVPGYALERMIETEMDGVEPFISGIKSIMNVHLISSTKASSGLVLR